MAKVFACEIHGECSLFKKEIGVKNCNGCSDYLPIK